MDEQPLTADELAECRRDLTELHGGARAAMAAAWAPRLRATVDAQARRVAALEAALLRYVDSDQCDCDPVGDDLTPCHWCEGSRALGYTVDLEERSEAAQAWLQTHTESEGTK